MYDGMGRWGLVEGWTVLFAVLYHAGSACLHVGPLYYSIGFDLNFLPGQLSSLTLFPLPHPNPKLNPPIL